MARPTSILAAANESESEFRIEEQERASRRVSWIPYPDLGSEEPDPYYTQEEFLQQCAVNGDEVYRRVNAAIAECKGIIATKNDEMRIMDIELADAKEEIAQLKSRIKDKDAAILDLTGERDRFRDAFAQQALQNYDNPGSGPIPPRKSVKIPDPPILTDGKEPTFEDWLLRMEDKLAANADHYPTPALRLAYVKSRCGGRAADHIISRSRSSAMNKYRDSTDI